MAITRAWTTLQLLNMLIVQEMKANEFLPDSCQTQMTHVFRQIDKITLPLISMPHETDVALSQSPEKSSFQYKALISWTIWGFHAWSREGSSKAFQHSDRLNFSSTQQISSLELTFTHHRREATKTMTRKVFMEFCMNIAEQWELLSHNLSQDSMMKSYSRNLRQPKTRLSIWMRSWN